MTEETIIWCGIDVSDKTFDVSLVHDEKISEYGAVPAAKFYRTKHGVSKFLDWLTDNLRSGHLDTSKIGITMEATGRMSVELYALLHANDREWHSVAIVNPRLIKAFIDSLGTRNKTDKQDAKGIGFYGRERTPVTHQPLNTDDQKLRELVRYRRTMVTDKTALTLRQSSSIEAWSIKDLKKRIRGLEKSILHCEKEIQKVIDGNQRLMKDFVTLKSMPGVGPITAWTVLGELGDLRRFKRSRQLAAMTGTCPTITESGTSVWRPPRLSKQGGALVREVLYMAAMSSVRMENSSFHDTYEHLISRGKPGKVALCAVMRKMIVTMRAMVVNDTPYDLNFQTVAKRGKSGGKPASTPLDRRDQEAIST